MDTEIEINDLRVTRCNLIQMWHPLKLGYYYYYYYYYHYYYE
jgi:hypothetical protein